MVRPHEISATLWLIIASDKDCPAEAKAAATETERHLAWKEQLDWKLRDQVAMGNIKGACKTSQIPFIDRDNISGDVKGAEKGPSDKSVEDKCEYY
jgi:hypothetical protein